MELGNLDAKRDWSDSEDFVRGVWLMLDQYKPKDFILSSNETHSIREFVEKAFAVAEIYGEWKGKGLDEQFVLPSGEALLKINEEFFRPAEVEALLGDSNPIRNELGWRPNVTFTELVTKMTLNDLN